MHEELNQFVRNEVWELAPRPENVHVIDTKWIFKNKRDEDCCFVCFCCLYIVAFDQSFHSCVSKIQKPHKKLKIKSLIDIVEFCLKTCFALYLCANGFMHLRA